MAAALSFIETYSGIAFHPLAPNPESIRIADIAHAISNQCRFAGHTRTFYSVAEHCVRVSRLLDVWGHTALVSLWGLLHDASEAYLVDLPTPLKQSEGFAPYREAEMELMVAVCRTFGLPEKEPAAVRRADSVLLATEARDLMPFKPEHWGSLAEDPLEQRIVPWSAEEAERAFLIRFHALRASRGEV